MPIETSVSPDHPLMQAWRAYQSTDEYSKTARWAPTHTADSLWAAFEQGWQAANANADQAERRQIDHEQHQSTLSS